jgi:hypothetical protein
MSTRAVYTFKDKMGTFHVYKHHDGYPSGAAQWIDDARANAWQLPRFEADEFGAAFIQVNKEGAGGVRLTHGPKDHGDIEYTYEITCVGGVLNVKACRVDYSGAAYEKQSFVIIFNGPLTDFLRFTKEDNANA